MDLQEGQAGGLMGEEEWGLASVEALHPGLMLDWEGEDYRGVATFSMPTLVYDR